MALSRKPKRRYITEEEYTHLKQCESFIDDNELFWKFEAYKDVIKHIENTNQVIDEQLNKEEE